MEGADVDLGGPKTSQPCSKRSLRQIQNGDSKHVWCVQGQFLARGRVRGEHEADGGAEQEPRDLILPQLGH